MTQQSQPKDPASNADCDACGSAPVRVGDGVRCGCGSLLARYVNGRLELKCRRCKRTVLVQSIEDTPG